MKVGWAVLALLLVTAVVALAAPYIITDPGDKETINGAIFESWTPTDPTGTGLFNPFLRISGNADVVAGYNTLGTVEFETDQAWVDALPLNILPIVEDGGVLYREFLLDTNQTNSDSFLSIDEFELYLTDNPALSGYDSATKFGAVADWIYDLDEGEDNWVVLDSSLSAGSGKRDVRVLVPDTEFQGSSFGYCAYAEVPCNTYVVLYSMFGGNENNNDGFEEWGTGIRPYVEVEKSAVPEFTRTHDWDITKEVTPATWDLFDGESGTSWYTVTLEHEGYTDSDWAVSGFVTITNPLERFDIFDRDVKKTSSVDAVIESVEDILTPGAVPLTLDCGVTFSYTLEPGEELVCSYSYGPLASGSSGSNDATVNLEGGQSFSASADFDFTGDPTDEVDEEVNVTDTNGESWGPVSDNATWTYERTFACGDDEGTHDNTAMIVETGQSDSASVDVDCYDLVVTKDAHTALTRTHEWDIDKSVEPDEWYLFVGERGESQYTVTVTKTGYTDSDWVVTGTIYIYNSSGIGGIPATINGVADVVSPDIAATVDCGETFPYVLAGGGTLECSYEADLPDGGERTNEATATQQLYDYDWELVATDAGTMDYSDDVAVSFADPDITDVYDEINVTDTNGESWGPVSGDMTWTYEMWFDCTMEGANGNTATIVETGQSDDANVDVACFEVTADKDATPTFNRYWEWAIDKEGTDTFQQLWPGETYDVSYQVTVTPTSYTDADWAVAGAITLTNPAPMDAELTGVVDQVDGVVAVHDCGGATAVPAEGELVCSYSADLPDGEDYTNVATATQQLYEFPYGAPAAMYGTDDHVAMADVIFGADPLDQIDECVDVYDTHAVDATTNPDGYLGEVCYDDGPTTFPYSITFGPFEIEDCGITFDFPNTAKLVTNDTLAEATADWLVQFEILCAGCTYTQGYWKNHDWDSNHYDPLGAWSTLFSYEVEIESVTYADSYFLMGGQADFFLSGKSWSEVFDTPPKGGNAYYILAHQWMAAYLNTKKAEPAYMPSEVQDAWNEGLKFFILYGPDDDFEDMRDDLIGWAGTLAAFNEGDIGFGHCVD
jgi:hypothetical protein